MDNYPRGQALSRARKQIQKTVNVSIADALESTIARIQENVCNPASYHDWALERAQRMLLSKMKMTEEIIAMFSTWRHSGFHVFCGNRISPDEETAMENLARYIIRE